MKPRILKKLCKKVREINPQAFADAWVDEEAFGWERYRRLWSRAEYQEARAKARRQHYATKSPISHCWMTGGDFDYWGEATEPHYLYDLALDEVMWKFGVETTEVVTDEDGSPVDEVTGWPIPHKRLTGQEVLKKYRELRHA